VKAAALAAALLPCLALAEEPPLSLDARPGAVVDKFSNRLIDRPLLLPAGHFDVQLLGNVSNVAQPDGSAPTGEVGAVGLELGDGEQQFGVALALPVSPELAFGSVVGSLSQAIAREAAVRIDLAFEHGKSHDQTPDLNIYSIGAGLPFKVRLTHELALVGGGAGALAFAHFTNLDAGGVNNYLGAASNLFSSSDLIVYSRRDDRAALFAINVPVGLLWQPVQALSLTLHTGYALLLSGEDGSSPRSFLPLGLEVVVSPAKVLDVGASFSVAGALGSPAGVPAGYLDIRLFTLWLRFRA
jgi:hypothetical protein